VYSTIEVNTANKIMVIKLNRPKRLNAFSKLMLDEIIDILAVAEKEDQVRVVVFTGVGNAFCSGMDLEKGQKSFEENVPMGEFRDIGGILSLRLYEFPKPLIAAINGHAVGVGITMTLPMDIRIVAEDAKIGFVFTRRGIAPESCSSWFLPKIVGITKASEWVLTGKMVPVFEGLEAGLFNQVVPKEKVIPVAIEIALEIAENTSATSVALIRQLMWRMLGSPHPKHSHLLESKMIYWTGSQEDAHEGVSSFLEKRKPNFTMSVSKDMPDFYPW
jgi:enoyl-CoA hydratase/carnithine racemase